jgi:hypothetical protein
MRRAGWLAFALVTVLRAQYPPDIQWRKIVTPHFEVVFLREIAADAERAANALETLYGPLTTSLGTSFLKRTTVLLPNAGITRYVSGYVSLFPRMAVFNSMPAQGFWLSPDAGRIAVVEYLPDRQCSLVVLDAGTGDELRRLASPGNEMIYSPAWPFEGARVVFVNQSGAGRALTEVDLASGRFHEVIPARSLRLDAHRTGSEHQPRLPRQVSRLQRGCARHAISSGALQPLPQLI